MSQMQNNIVTAIKELSGRRRLVYINYEPAFALYSSEIKKYDITTDISLSDTIYNDIIHNILDKRAIARAMNLLVSKDYSEHELHIKLQDSYYPLECIEQAITYVKSFGYLNDERYAANYIAFKALTKSRKQIELFLSGKGIDKHIIEHECDLYYSENEEAELEQILSVMRKKADRFDELGYKEKCKLMNYFYNKGFNSDNIKKALDIIVDERYNTYFS